GPAVTGDGWFATRDAGWLDEDGYLFLEGRLDDVIVRGGENIAPAEIEQVIQDHPGVDQVAVCAVPDQGWGEGPVAFVVRRPGAGLTAAQVQDWVQGRLRSTRIPAYIEFVPELPYSELGKLLRRSLRDDFARRAAAASAAEQ